MGNAAFVFTKEYSDDKYWTEAILDDIIDQLSDQFGLSTFNLDQLKADLFPSSYVYNDDGNGTLTNPLYNKQSQEVFYDTGDVALGTTTNADFVTIDATNYSIEINAELEGKYLVRMHLPVNIVPTGGTILNYAAYFRMQDDDSSPNNSNPTSFTFSPAVIDGAMTFNVIVEGIFDWDVGTHNVFLQKRIITATNLATHNGKGSAGLYGFYAYVIKL